MAAPLRLRLPGLAVVVTALVVLAAATLVTVPTSAGAVTADAATPGAGAAAPGMITGEACLVGEGVTVVVDFTALIDEVRLGCAPGAQPTGRAALDAVGIATTEVPGIPGTICTVDGLPTEGYPACWLTDGFWSLWSADAGAWDFSTLGIDEGPVPVDAIIGLSWAADFTSAAPRLAVSSLGQIDSRAAAALDWLSAELAVYGDVFPGPTGDVLGWGITVDAVLALAAGGRAHRPRAVASTDAVATSLASYLTWDDFGAEYEGVLLAGPLAKTLFMATVTHLDPNDVHGWDLEAELRARQELDVALHAGRFTDRGPHGSTPDGERWAFDQSNGFSQAYAVLALARTPAGVPAAAVDYLLAQQCPDGGFRLVYESSRGCTTASATDTDATAMAVQALLSIERTPQVQGSLTAAVTWLLAHQDPAGAWAGTGPTAAPNTNSTGLAGNALAAAGHRSEADAGATWVAARQLRDGEAGAAEPDAGAIAYTPGAYDAAVAAGIAPAARDQWRRATPQAVLALGLVPFARIGDDTPVTAVSPVDFTDVTSTHPFFVDIAWLVGAAITTGYDDGTFRPTAPVSRQATAAFLYRLAGSPPVVLTDPPTFSDVGPAHPFRVEIEWLVAKGIATGYTDGTFRPTAPVTRQATAAFLHRYADEPAPDPAAPSFTDVGATHPFAAAITWMAGEAITTGYDDGTFRPTADISRQALAAFLRRFDQAVASSP